MSAWFVLSPLACLAGVMLGYYLARPTPVDVALLMVPPTASSAPPALVAWPPESVVPPQ